MFWEFATCVASNGPQTSQKLLLSRDWGAEEKKEAQNLAQRNANCGTFELMTFSPALFRGALASAIFVKAHRGQALPDYSSVKFPVSAEEAKRLEQQAGNQQLVLLMFANCVFRNRAEPTRALLDTRPFSAAENKQWQVLDSVMGGCLTAAEGSQVRFTRVKLRALLGEAAYLNDWALAEKAHDGEHLN